MNQDFLDLLGALSDAEVRFLIVGGYAVGVHGHPRATKELDVWVEASPENAARVMAALRAFGSAWARRVTRKFGGHECSVISIEDLITNKRAAGRPQDLADVDELLRIRNAVGRG